MQFYRQAKGFGLSEYFSDFGWTKTDTLTKSVYGVNQ